ncbi:MAG: hypothetical protein LBQ66_13755 [Planctomycetaceae bacterium]|jgi:type II secretory pathway pseudopilin PulG|nr:hypothetical protein [Planctomycetaceae bacterium]
MKTAYKSPLSFLYLPVKYSDCCRVNFAFTLVEILIALVLMTIMLGLVAVSVDVYLRQMVVSRSEVEESRLARALLDQIAQELRSVVVLPTEEELSSDIDAELLVTLFGSTASSAGTGAAATTSSNTASTDDNSDTSTDGGQIPTESSSVTAEIESVAGTIPGIYGDVEWIQIDMTRLPRGELFGAKKTRVGSQYQTDRLSATKTVFYYLGKDTGQITADDPRYNPDQLIGSLGRLNDNTALQYGLFKRELDRQVTQYIINEGKETDYEQYDEVIAPEVEWIQYAYFDPAASTTTNKKGDWIDYWDMDEKKSLPKAVKITIAIRRQIFGDALIKWSEQTGESIPTNIYSRIVLLPVTTESNSETTETETETESESESTATNNTTTE